MKVVLNSGKYFNTTSVTTILHYRQLLKRVQRVRHSDRRQTTSPFTDADVVNEATWYCFNWSLVLNLNFLPWYTLDSAGSSKWRNPSDLNSDCWGRPCVWLIEGDINWLCMYIWVFRAVCNGELACCKTSKNETWFRLIWPVLYCNDFLSDFLPGWCKVLFSREAPLQLPAQNLGFDC